jgi:hypothetical protein
MLVRIHSYGHRGCFNKDTIRSVSLVRSICANNVVSYVCVEPEYPGPCSIELTFTNGDYERFDFPDREAADHAYKLLTWVR